MLAFGCQSCETTHTNELFTIRTDGRGLKMLRRACGEQGDPDFPAWSPDGERLAYSCNFASGGGIWTSRADGSGGRPLTQAARRFEQYEPAWSANGRQLAWDRRAFSSQTWSIVVSGADGSGERLLAKGLSPSWSRRGRLVFASGSGLATIGADGSRRWRLLGRGVGRGRPAWSPNGRSIAFVDADHGEVAVRVVDLTNYRVRTLARVRVNPAENPVSTAWSPDSRWLAYGIGGTPAKSKNSYARVELWAVRVVDGASTQVYSGEANAIRGISWRP